MSFIDNLSNHLPNIPMHMLGIHIKHASATNKNLGNPIGIDSLTNIFHDYKFEFVFFKMQVITILQEISWDLIAINSALNMILIMVIATYIYNVECFKTSVH